jgi:hypothetical protein
VTRGLRVRRIGPLEGYLLVASLAQGDLDTSAWLFDGRAPLAPLVADLASCLRVLAATFRTTTRL